MATQNKMKTNKETGNSEGVRRRLRHCKKRRNKHNTGIPRKKIHSRRREFCRTRVGCGHATLRDDKRRIVGGEQAQPRTAAAPNIREGMRCMYVSAENIYTGTLEWEGGRPGRTVHRARRQQRLTRGAAGIVDGPDVNVKEGRKDSSST
jgi:hypothetical protein